jgi:hypothetical protein
LYSETWKKKIKIKIQKIRKKQKKMEAVAYEVNLRVKKEVEAPFLQWLRAHIRDMVETHCFVSAHLYQEEEQQASTAEGTSGNETEYASYVAVYSCANRAALQRYFDEHAPALRADGLQRFPNQFSATRRILHQLA